jgi:hypothetical protein
MDLDEPLFRGRTSGHRQFQTPPAPATAAFQMTATRTSPRASISTRVWLDIALFAGYVLLSAPQTTGIPFHEYFTVVFIPIFVAHIVLDWAWIARVFRRSERTRPGETRFNRAFDVVLFVAMVVVIYSGFLISESILPDFGIEPVANGFWAMLHEASGNLLLLLVGIHLALHWPWIKRNLGRIRPNRALA